MKDKNKINFDDQFKMNQKDYINGIDTASWMRHYFIIREAVKFKPKNVLEIGVGNGIVKETLRSFVENYVVMDVNERLKPDIVNDVRNYKPELKGKFDFIICSEVLEHIPFNHLKKSIRNIFVYLNNDGKALISVPNREKRFAILDLFSSREPLVISIPKWIHTPSGYFYLLRKGGLQKDPYHHWEIGIDRITKEMVEDIIKEEGFAIYYFKKLPYVDFWVLRK